MKDMENFIQKVLWKDVLISCLFLIMGILLLVSPKDILEISSYFIGALLILNGILYLCDVGNGFSLFDPLIMGILSIIFGLVIFIYPTLFINMVPILLGFWFIITGAVKCRLAFILKGVNDGDWVSMLIMAIITIICGFLLVIFPNMGAISITIVLGVLLVVYSIDSIINGLIVKKKVKDIAKALKVR